MWKLSTCIRNADENDILDAITSLCSKNKRKAHGKRRNILRFSFVFGLVVSRRSKDVDYFWWCLVVDGGLIFVLVWAVNRSGMWGKEGGRRVLCVARWWWWQVGGCRKV